MSRILERLSHLDQVKDEAPASPKSRFEEVLAQSSQSGAVQQTNRTRRALGFTVGALLVGAGYFGLTHSNKSDITAVQPVIEAGFAQKYTAAVKQIAAHENTPAVEKLLRQWMSEHPDELRIQVSLALLLKTSGQLDEARKLLQHVVDQDPADALALNNLGMVLLAKGEAAPAYTLLEKSYTLQKNEEVLLNMARAAELANDFIASQNSLKSYLAEYAPAAKIKATVQNRLRLLSSLAYLQKTTQPHSLPLRQPASKKKGD